MGTPGASVLVLHITGAYLFIGVDGTIDKAGYANAGEFLDDLEDAGAVGFYVDNANLDLAIISEPAGPTAKKWVGVAASIASLGVTGLPDAFSLKIKDLQLLFNLPAVGGSRMDWKALSTNAADGFNLNLGALSLLDNSLEFKVAGSVYIAIENFVYVSGSVALQRKTLFVKTVGSAPGTPATEMSVLSIGASDLRAFVGIGDADSDDNDQVDDVAVLQENAIGVSLAIDNLAIVLAKPVVVAPAAPSTKSYFALSGAGSASLIGVEGVQISGRVAIEISKGADSAAAPGALVPAIDFVASASANRAAFDPDALLPGNEGRPLGLYVPTGPDADDFVIVGFNENNLLRVSGYISISVSEFFHVSGQFSFAQSGTPQTVKIAGSATTKQVNVMTIGASDVNAFVGIGGPYFVDSNGDGLIDESDTPESDGAMGFVLRNLDFALALFKPTNPAVDKSSYYAIQASGGAEVVGIDGITIRADVLGVQINGGKDNAGLAQALDLKNSPSFAATAGLVVQTGLDPDGAGDLEAPTIKLDFTAGVIRAFGSVTLIIDNFVYVSGNFEFVKSAAPLTVVIGSGPGAVSKTVNVLTVGASNVNAFIGVGDPDSNGDGLFNQDDDPEANDAIGLAITNLEFGLALFKPVALADRSSYYALRASANGIALVGVPGVSIAATDLQVAVNGASAPTTGAASPTAPPAPVINFTAAGSSFGSSGFTVGTGGGNTVVLDMATRTIAASGNVSLGLDFNADGTPEISLSSFVSFEQSFRGNAQVIKIALTNLSFVLGDPADPVFELSGLSGLFLITPQGMAASITVPPSALTINGDGFSISGSLTLQISTLSTPLVNEVFVTGVDELTGNPITTTLTMSKGPFLRLTGSVAVTVNIGDGSSAPFVLSGNFTFEQLTLADPDGTGPLPAPKMIRIGVSELTATVLGVGLLDGQGGFVFTPNGVAGVLRVTIDANTGDPGVPSLDGDVILQINNTGGAVNQSISVGNTNIAINFTAAEGRVVRFAVLNASIVIPPFFELTGDFTVQTDGDMTLYGARNVEIFLGSIPLGQTLRDENGALNPDAIGLLVTNATLGLVKWAAAPGAGANTPARYAVYAYGEASFVGLDGLTISGSVTVRLNNSGVALDKSIVLPSDPLASVPVASNGQDDDGDGLIDEAGEQAAVRVKFNSAAKIEEFSAGFNELGELDPDTALTISAAGIFTISGAVSFTRMPNGQVNVDMPFASVNIAIPVEGSLQPVFGISGAARFNFGGPGGFQLEDLRVSGYSIFGVGATIAAPASSLRAPTADLANPTSTAIVSINNLTYLAVTYQDPNRAGMNESSILDAAAEFLVSVTRSDGTPITGLTVNNGAVQKFTEATNDRTYLYPITMTDAFKAAVATAGANGVTVTVTFVDATWSDARGVNGAAEVERFTLYAPAATPGGAAPAQGPYATLASPANGGTAALQTLNAQRYIDVTFNSPTGAPIIGIDGDELKLTGAGTANLAKNPDGTVMATVIHVSGNTFRYLLTPKTGVDPKNLFVAGDVNVQFVAGSWTTGAGASAAAAVRTDEVFTISATLQTAGAASNAIALGPLSLEGPSVTLAKTQFVKGKLILTVAIGVDVASLAFGGSQAAGAQSSSGITAKLTGLLGTFDVVVDVQMALAAITGGGNLLDAFSVPGKFGLQIGSLKVEIPGALIVSGSGIMYNYDPNYDPAKNGGLPQKLLVVNQAQITFPSFGITGQINPSNGMPGLVVYTNGFDIGEAQLIYKPGVQPAPAPGATGPAPMTQTSGGTGKIGIAGILEFDDLRVGVTDFKVPFGQDIAFDGTIFFASGGARFLPGKPVSATISDRLSVEPDIAPGVPDTEALRLGLDFENGKVKGFIFKADTLKITLGSFLTLNATDVDLNTSAAADEEIVSFRSLGAEVTIGSLVIGGEARNFAFLGDGTFVTKPGFGVFLSVGAADGASFKWPSWLPIKITEIGLTWPDIQNDPANFVLTLSAAVTGLQGMSGLEFSGAIEGVKIDVGLLLQGKFPIIDIASIGVSLKGKMFGGEITAGLIGGIIKLDANGAEIDNFDTTTPVADRVFFVGVEGGFKMAGVGGFTIKFAVSELGPLGVFISASMPGGIVLEPNTGLAINDFSAGVEFFKTLPSIDKPEELRGPDFQLPTALSADEWLASVRAQVVKQYRAIQADPSKNGFTAAFTSPMLITGGAKIFTIYASKETFNGEIILRISTDGKILVIGKLNFAADNLSITGRLYADLSKIAAGEATVLFLADIPDQVQLLTIDGRFKMGFRNPSTGEEATFTVVDPKTGKPYVRIIGPSEGGVVGTGTLTGRGYLVVDLPAGPAGAVLNLNTVTDLSPEFKLAASVTTVTIDNTQAPVIVDGKFWYWVKGEAPAATVSIIWLKETWSYTAYGRPGGVLLGRRLPGCGQRLAGRGGEHRQRAGVHDSVHRRAPGALGHRRDRRGDAAELRHQRRDAVPQGGHGPRDQPPQPGRQPEVLDLAGRRQGAPVLRSERQRRHQGGRLCADRRGQRRLAGFRGRRQRPGQDLLLRTRRSDRGRGLAGQRDAPAGGRARGERAGGQCLSSTWRSAATPGASLDYASILDGGQEFDPGRRGAAGADHRRPAGRRRSRMAIDEDGLASYVEIDNSTWAPVGLDDHRLEPRRHGQCGRPRFRRQRHCRPGLGPDPRAGPGGRHPVPLRAPRRRISRPATSR